jgi:hypothetical protein
MEFRVHIEPSQGRRRLSEASTRSWKRNRRWRVGLDAAGIVEGAEPEIVGGAGNRGL